MFNTIYGQPKWVVLDLSFNGLSWHDTYNNYTVDCAELINFTVWIVPARHVSLYELKFYRSCRPGTIHLSSLSKAHLQKFYGYIFDCKMVGPNRYLSHWVILGPFTLGSKTCLSSHMIKPGLHVIKRLLIESPTLA